MHSRITWTVNPLGQVPFLNMCLYNIKYRFIWTYNWDFWILPQYKQKIGTKEALNFSYDSING